MVEKNEMRQFSEILRHAMSYAKFAVGLFCLHALQWDKISIKISVWTWSDLEVYRVTPKTPDLPKTPSLQTEPEFVMEPQKIFRLLITYLLWPKDITETTARLANQ